MESMKKKISNVLLCVLLLSGCSDTASESTASASSDTAVSAISGDVYSQYEATVNGYEAYTNYTVAVSNSYEMSYSDDTMDVFELDGVLQVNGDTAHYTQNINSNGTRSEMEGNYYDGTLYNVYNSVSYYEEMELDELSESLLVPLEPTLFDESVIAALVGTEYESGNITYMITIADSYLEEIFESRYDQYGLDSYDDLTVSSGVIRDTFDEDGNFISETAEFETTITYSGEEISVVYTSAVNYTSIDTTDVEISDETKETESAYVAFEKIDTSEIETLTSDDDTAEDTVTATFQKRLVNRLGYEETEDGVYESSFNNDNEVYTIDFNNYNFEYSNRTIHYIYNWKSETGYMGSCNVDFNTGYTSSECVDSTVETIKEVESWLEMELYYCGLTLEGLTAECE